jgi:hypothetical protein
MTKVITRTQARKQGLPHYYTGKPCKYGHVAERAVRNCDCMLCERIRCRERYWRDLGVCNIAAQLEAD